MKAYITKYALTTGIIEVDGEVNPKLPEVLKATVNKKEQFYKINEWFTSKEDAIKQAEKMRVREIRLIKKRLEKLENLKFI